MDKDHLSLLDGPDDLQRASVCGSSAPARIDTDSIAGLQRQLGTKFLTKNLRCLRSGRNHWPSRCYRKAPTERGTPQPEHDCRKLPWVGFPEFSHSLYRGWY